MMMKYIFTAALMLTLLNFSYSQSFHYGGKFEFDVKSEKEAQFVLKDNYNHYLLTVINEGGMMPVYQVILRKFDQKNDLIETFKGDFPKMDGNAQYKYLDFADNNSGKVAVFVEAHSGKSKMGEIYKLEFDKASAKFTTTLLASNPIISLGKAGDIDLEKSDNEKYIAISFHKYREKETPDKSLVIMLDGNTLNVAWQKELSFDNEYTSQNFTVTNSGKMVLVRDMKGSKKGITYLTVIAADGQEDKNFESPIFFNELKAISIGPQDYLITFNSDSKNFRSDYFNSLLLYDLKSGKILGNNKITQFASLKDLQNVEIRNVMLQNNEIYVFAEAKVASQVKPAAGGFYSQIAMPGSKFGPSYVYTLSFEGQLKYTKELNVDPYSEASLYHSFGLANIRGNYYINTGIHSNVYPLNLHLEGTEQKTWIHIDSRLEVGNERFINQLLYYFPDGDRLLLAETINKNEMSIVSVSGIK